MSILTKDSENKNDSYWFSVDQGGALDINTAYSETNQGSIMINFDNGILSHVECDMNHDCERSKWHVYEAIAKKITSIEKTYKAKP